MNTPARPPLDMPADAPAIESYQLPQLIRDLRTYQAELESQNKVLRYSQSMAEAASERFETLFSSVPLALMVIDEHDLVVQSNSMAQRSFQPTERDRPLNFLMPFVSATSAAAVQAAFAQARTEGHAEAKEVLFQIGDDGAITGDLHIARLDNAHEPVAHFICAVIDQGPLLAERRALLQSGAELQQRNEQLRLSEARLADIINSSLDAIVCVDRERRITVFNPTAAALFQCPPADALGSPLERFFPDAAEVLAMHQISTELPPTELQALTARGTAVPVEVSMAFGDTTTVFARDLTARKREEAQRNALEAQLRESQKMQAVGTMAGGIAHDFNNILHAILGNVELAKEDSGLNSTAQESLREIEKAGRRARDLVRQILTFSRNEAPRRVPTDLAEVTSETERLLRVTLPPQVELLLRVHPGVPAVLADPTQVEQAVLNLCTNAVQAIQATPEARGTVWIELQSEAPSPARCARLGLAPGHYARLSVRDNGPGMDPATRERIFEPFFTTKEVGQGTGLGLAVVHGVMRSNGGAVDVHSEPGRGSHFMLYFPSTSEAAEAAASAPPPPASVQGSGQHVMYVDDDQALVFLVERLLRRRGFRVSGFTDPHAATEALRAEPQGYDLVVTDYNMPGYCGVDLVREARGIRADLPVALASGYVTAEIEREAMAEGARALIHKPNDVQELCATVQRLLQENA
ncbi:ATP-binding protein [Pseudorhodoferax sp. Leaf265]|jgi:PAS domain S-box-containing protein|uniref:PAS domain-containing hybrid sensor histidine kinase/response regulator n=1 Tax=Pseudorhodoferax sp. Leaf265 TaxID=1736315 RepID=UPI0006F35831|nr:histidine kinase [Pseudorhodoferax sp. Leaf265]PZQ02438.1 MAG: hybrid sensor histidine kinase/response regulator [Variovorax paradoxus]PZQ15694.1 MAG: hybrid sensor histidine kinase/response regulator [Variovorax paradoxus]